MKKFRILMGAVALALVAATVFACTKDKVNQINQFDLTINCGV